MKVIKGVLFVLLLVASAMGAFNLIFILIGTYLGPLYESDADQSRNFAIWLFGNIGVMIVAAAAGIIWGRRRAKRI
jgi:membrane protein DedA with SNARE-associated domain